MLKNENRGGKKHRAFKNPWWEKTTAPSKQRDANPSHEQKPSKHETSYKTRTT